MLSPLIMIVWSVKSWRGAQSNSGSRNLTGLGTMANHFAAAMTEIGVPAGAQVRWCEPAMVEAIGADGLPRPLPHGRNLHLALHPERPRRVILVGHMDTVFPSDHSFQQPRWLDERTINGPGVADMKGGISVMFAALRTFTASPLSATLGIDVVLNADEEVSSLWLCGFAGRGGAGLPDWPLL